MFNEGKCITVGTHIDKLHPDFKEARKIASNKILPVLEKELCRKPYAQHIACISEALQVLLNNLVSLLATNIGMK